jgi:hypothetical protein
MKILGEQKKAIQKYLETSPKDQFHMAKDTTDAIKLF